mmetsp:Transcript_21388/g.32677  ORF Transcript_21388/g.32677 Transcript_21388/m.32677 type:complete len:83 (+) Transcript_21388:299-547(+)
MCVQYSFTPAVTVSTSSCQNRRFLKDLLSMRQSGTSTLQNARGQYEAIPLDGRMQMLRMIALLYQGESGLKISTSHLAWSAS